ncbi:UNVERIFIED_CONTAM: hypothetical protein OHV15_05130 [Microbacterium sp. SLM126]
MTPATSTRETTERTARSPADAARESPAASERSILRSVPRPLELPGVVAIDGQEAGGFEAVQAEWGPGGGEVVLTARRPFLDLTARASFDAHGAFDGRLAVRARLGVVGLGLGETTWTMTGWTPDDAMIAPRAALRGSDLVLDVSALPAETAISVDPSLTLARGAGTVTIGLPAGAVSEGRPLSPRIVELYRGLLGVDLSPVVVHPDAELTDAPASTAGADAFFAPGAYGEETPAALALLDAVVRAVLGQRSGPVHTDAPPPPTAERDVGGTVPVASTELVPATVPAGATGPTAAAEAQPLAVAGEAAAAGGAATDAAAADATATGGADAASAATGGAAPEGEAAPPPVEVLMPEAPTAPGPAATARGGAVAGGAGGAARSATDLPSAGEMTDAARGAVAEPVAETAARAREDLAAELGERPAPSPEIVELCERIRTAIRENRPEDEDALLEADPTQQARDAGATVTGSVDGQVTTVSGAYDEMGSPPTGTPALTPTPVTPADPASAGMGVDAASAAPDAIPPENTNLDADVAATDQRIADSGIDTRVTREIPDGPFEGARAARGELGELAQRTPEEIHAEEQTAIDAAQGDMAALQQQALAAMRTARGGAVTDTGAASEAATGTEVNTRDGVSQRAQAVFDAAQRQVETLLTPLSRTALAQWDAGLARLSREFHDSLDRVQRWIDERHSGVVGTIVAIGDYVAGLPGWVTDEYNRAERTFGDGVCDLLLSISSDVNAVIAAAQAVIRTAREDIDGLFSQMEAEFPEWAAQERARFAGRLDALDARVTQAQTSFVNDVSSRAITAVNEAHAAVEAKRQEAGGLIGRVVAAIEEFIDDPVRAIINGLLRLVGIPPGAFWSLLAQIEQVAADIAEDPETFINNLVAGVKQGFQQFFDNIGTHLLSGFWNWLFSGLRTPIPMPTSYDALSLMTFALQLMGITWPNVREILVRHVGPTAVEILEGAWQILSVLITQGPQGLVNMIKEQLAPENVVGMILDAAIEYITETLIVQVAQYIFSLLNPAGAVAQAIRLIYQVCAWIFRNAARIFAFVQAIVGGIANVMAGNIAGLAQTVERALASMLVVAIDFLAGMLGLGDLPDQVAEVITRLQTYVLGIIDRVVGFIVAQARALLRRLGIGGEDEPGDGDNDDEELGTTVRFSGGGESHRLWFDVAGSDATLMVASVPEPIGNKIAQWRATVSAGEPADPAVRAEASATLDSLEAVADEASDEGDQLAAAFLQAAADQNDENEPPSDDALENRQRAIAGMLTRLFTLFDEEPDPLVVFAPELEGVHPAAHAAIIAALQAIEMPPNGDWGAARARAEQRSPITLMKRGPLNRAHDYGSNFADTWAVGITAEALQAQKAALTPSADESFRKTVKKVLDELGDPAAIGPAEGDAYLRRYKAQVHSGAEPFGTTPTTTAYGSAWAQAGLPAAASALLGAMRARIAQPTSGPRGADLPPVVRAKVWELLAAATLEPPTGTTTIHIRLAAASVATMTAYLDTESRDSAHSAAEQSTIAWWRDHLDQEEFHHAWPQWLGGLFTQKQIFIPRALHNFQGMAGGPEGFHQVFNDLFRTEFAADGLAVNDDEGWAVFESGNALARDRLAVVLEASYRRVFALYPANGPAAVAVFLAEMHQTYPGGVSP